MSDLILRDLCEADQRSFLAAIEEFRVSDPEWDFAFRTEGISDFGRYVEMVNSWKEGENLREGFVPNSYLVAVLDGRVVGRSSIRHELNDELKKINGHIGYGVIPSERRKGYARLILEKSIEYLHARGVDSILVTCDENNIASRKTIESCGGVLENKVFTPEMNRLTCRYWINF